ncbi:hypothetical protein A0128_19380 [Leptospira tipperaryensis]|uniref:Uncharacterized protein n=1 Tax=Leptospira tipperaryensis TaxID=2564040 RepID=A0A1D7V311_9LEPT|nr:hypothetical protein A0128_19380 [Leptospira tipperaryensis]
MWENSEKLPLAQKNESRNSISILENLVGTPTNRKKKFHSHWELCSRPSPKKNGKKLSFSDRTQKTGI